MPAPEVTIVSVDRTKMSHQTSADRSQVVFKFDMPIQAYSVNILGTAPTTGTVAGAQSKYISDMKSMTVDNAQGVTVQALRQIEADTTITETIMDDELGVSAVDGSYKVNIYGKGLDGVWTPYIDDYAIRLLASGDYVRVPNTPSIQVTGDQTIEMLLKPSTLSGRRNPFNKAYGGEGTITHEPGGDFNYYWGTSGSNTSPYQGVNSGFKVQANELAHVAITRDLTAGIIQWYKNGDKGSSASASYASATASVSPLDFGLGYAGQWLGDIIEMRLWNVARTQQQIQDLMGATLNGDEPGLVGYWRFDEGTGMTANDSSPNGNNGALNGGVTWIKE